MQQNDIERRKLVLIYALLKVKKDIDNEVAQAFFNIKIIVQLDYQYLLTKAGNELNTFKMKKHS